MPKISVVVPNYNHAEFLNLRFKTILSQTHHDIEVIILDDSSTDSSREIIEEYRGHPKIKHIIYNTENSGSPFLQWKKGIELASGDWIWLAESDDWCESSLLEELVSGSTRNPNCVISYCQSLMIEGNNILLRNGPGKMQENINGITFVEKHMLNGNAIFNASMCIFKKSEYYNITQQFTKYKFSGDWLFWIELALKGDVYISGKTLNYFRKHKNDVSSGANINGLAYKEYLKSIVYLKQLNYLSDSKAAFLLYEKLKSLLKDSLLNIESKKEVIIEYKNYSWRIYYKAIILRLLTRLKYLIKMK